jgi:two-component system nitrate/nitrite response regulator NarL
MRTRQASRKTRIRILIADREGVFRLGVKKLFALEDDLRVVAEAETAPQVVSLSASFKPHVSLVQLEILEEVTSSLIAKLRGISAQSRVVITASALAEDQALRCVQDGASGVLLKTLDPPLFVKCVRKVADGKIWLPKQRVAQMAKLRETRTEGSPRPVDTLTRREKAIINCLMQGWHNREISHQLSITEQTVKNHLRSIYDKVGASDRLELVLYAIHQHLDLPPLEPLGARP